MMIPDDVREKVARKLRDSDVALWNAGYVPRNSVAYDDLILLSQREYLMEADRIIAVLVDAQPQPPEPDWDEYPWANWAWLVKYDKPAMTLWQYSENEPRFDDNEGPFVAAYVGRWARGERLVDVPVGIDWRVLRKPQPRPEPQAEAVLA